MAVICTLPLGFRDERDAIVAEETGSDADPTPRHDEVTSPPRTVTRTDR
jgi:hypothetical protein